MPVSLATFAYPRVDGAARSQLLGGLDRRPPEVFVLSTCLRVEVLVPGDVDTLNQARQEMWSDVGVEPEVRTGIEAVTHLFRVAAGLESPILGEAEVLTQMRRAVADLKTGSGQVDGLFLKLLETAVAIGREARQVLPASPHASLAAVAAQVVGGADRVAVLGSGAMASAVVDALGGLPAPPAVTMVARSPEKVRHPGLAVWPLARAAEVLAEFPAVVSATAAPAPLIDREGLTAVLAGRRHPLVLVDMAMPPDLPARGRPGVAYLDIDDLARLADRRPRSGAAEELVGTAADEAYRRLSDHHRKAPLIGGLLRTADDVVEETVRRFSGRLTHPRDREILHQAAHTVARTLMAGPVDLVNRNGSTVADETISAAFGLDDG